VRRKTAPTRTSGRIGPQEHLHMPPTTTGTIKRITDKGFGFIAAADGTE
jgi:hypothetical protein